MKKLFIITLAVGLLASITACQASTTSLISQTTMTILPVSQEGAADDIVGGPGGIVYKANIHQEGVENPWPTIETTTVTLEKDVASLLYRDYIQTEAGANRYNILSFDLPPTYEVESNYDLNLYAINVPDSIEIAEGSRSSMAYRGGITSVLIFTIAPDAEAGVYDIQIAIELDGKDYGPVPCTIEVL
jgi:hypothetical protein